ncbi:MAG: tetratricopeptide repeat protein [Candidatus Melainabacteria bacterium]|nr:tetratricopeptide repeat protein [Candidatus Melainabacteria bacterium]
MGHHEKLKEGVKHFEEGDYVLSLQILKEALEEARKEKASPLELAIIQTELGSTCSEIGEFETGKRELNEAIGELNKSKDNSNFKYRAKAKINLSSILMKESEYKSAIALLRELLDDKELKDCTEELGTALDQLGEIAWRQGNARDAESHFKEGLEKREQIFGQKGRYYGGSLGNCALILYADGRLLESEEMQKRSLQIKEEALGRVHPELVCTLSNLAMISQRLRRFEEAETLLKRALTICDTAYGANSLTKSFVSNNLGGIFLEQGKYKDAVGYFEIALAAREKFLGKNNPALIKIINNVALVYRKLGRDKDAQAMADRVKELIEISIKDENHSDPMSFILLSDLHSREKNKEKSIEVIESGIERMKKVYGEKSIECANMHDSAGSIYVTFKDYSNAQDHFAKAVSTKKEILGMDNPDLAKSLRHLSLCLSMEGDFEASNLVKAQADIIDKKHSLPDSTEMLMRKQVEVFKQKYGENHKTVVESLRMLSYTLSKRGLHDEANLVQKEYLEKLTILHGDNTLELAQELIDQATMAWSGQEFEKAVELSARVLDIFSKNEEAVKSSLQYAGTYERIATFYESAQEISMVEGLLKKAMEIRMQKQGANHWRVRGLLMRLAAICRSQDKHEEAQNYDEMADSIPKPSDEQIKADMMEESQYMLQRIMGNLTELAKAYEQEEQEE